MIEYRSAVKRRRRFEFLARSCATRLPVVIAERAAKGPATLVDGELEVEPGISLWPAPGTYTAGRR